MRRPNTRVQRTHLRQGSGGHARIALLRSPLSRKALGEYIAYELAGQTDEVERCRTKSWGLTQTEVLPMTRPFLVAMLAVGAICVPLRAQEVRTAEEKAVWALIESSGQALPKVMDDVILVSGAYPRPIIGRQSKPSDTGMAEAEAEMKKRSAVVLKTRPQRVVVAKAGDMAYGFALFDMEFDRPDSAGKSEHVKFEGSQLTVWRKVGGEWLLAASFNRPNE